VRLHLKAGILFRGPAVVAGPRRTKAEPSVYRLHPQALIVGIGCRSESWMKRAGLLWIKRRRIPEPVKKERRQFRSELSMSHLAASALLLGRKHLAIGRKRESTRAREFQ